MIELHMFPMSHYNEKARWGLDFKGVAHRRIPYLPGPHAGRIRKLSGQEKTPVVRWEDGTITAGSTPILLELERRYREPALVPDDEAACTEAMDLVAWFDEEVGPIERRGFFVALVEEPDYMCRMFAQPHPALTRFVYRRMVPLVKGRMKASFGITGPESREEGLAMTRRAFDLIAEKTADTGYLAGARFTIADLTAAAIMAPSVEVEHPDMRKPEPKPASVQAWYDAFRDHPGAEWVREMYRRHRPAPMAVAA